MKTHQNPKRRHSDHKWGDNFFLFAITVAVIMLVSVIAAGVVRADVLAEVGAKQAIYDDAKTGWSFQGNLGDKAWPVYAFIGYEDEVDYKLLGQPVAETDILSFGVGARKRWDDVFVALEVGYASLDNSVNQKIADEAVYSYLAGRHGVGGRVVPVRNPYRGYSTSWEADDGLLGRLVVGYQLMDNVAVTGSYRWLNVDQEMTLKDDSWREGRGYWREDTTLDLSAFEIGVWYTY